MYALHTSKIVDKFLAKHNDVRARLLNALELLAQNPYPNHHLDIKRLQRYENHYRLRIGKYRILYEVIESCILIYAYDIDSRGSIYKQRRNDDR